MLTQWEELELRPSLLYIAFLGKNMIHRESKMLRHTKRLLAQV